MSVEWVAWSAAAAIFVCLLFRFCLRKESLFSVGGIALLTAILPHYVLYPLFMLIMDDPRVSTPQFAQGLSLVIFMLGGLYLGTLAGRGRTIPLLDGLYDVRIPRHVLWGLYFVTVSCILGIFFAILGTANPLDILHLARTPEFRVGYMRYHLGYPFLFLTGALYFGQALLIADTYRRRGRGALGVALSISVLTAFLNLSFGSRSAFFVPLLIFLFITHHQYRRIPSSLVVLLGALFVPVFVLIRLLSVGATTDLLKERGLLTDAGFYFDEFVARFNLFVGLMDFLEWFDGRAHVMGASFLNLVLRPIPRWLLPDKPASFDVWLSYEIYGRPEYGGGVMLFGGVVELFYNFSYVGLVLWFVFVGVILYRLHYHTGRFLRRGRYLPACMVISNVALLRGLVNVGITTSSLQQILVAAASQFVVLGILLTFQKSALLVSKRRAARETAGASARSAPVSDP